MCRHSHRGHAAGHSSQLMARKTEEGGEAKAVIGRRKGPEACGGQLRAGENPCGTALPSRRCCERAQPTGFVTTHWKDTVPTSLSVDVNTRVGLVAPAMLLPPRFHWYLPTRRQDAQHPALVVRVCFCPRYRSTNGLCSQPRTHAHEHKHTHTHTHTHTVQIPHPIHVRDVTDHAYVSHPLPPTYVFL